MDLHMTEFMLRHLLCMKILIKAEYGMNFPRAQLEL